jgi:hypothetical protein
VINVASAAIIFIFVALGLWTSLAREERTRQLRVSLLALYAIAISALVAFTEHDAWPFSTYPVYGDIPDVHLREVQVEARVVDSAGRENSIHPIAFAPLPMIVMNQWLLLEFPRLSEEQRIRAASFLLNRIADQQLRACHGQRAAGESFLGKLTAPPELTSEAFTIPEYDCRQQLVELRMYEMSWSPAERFEDPQRVDRRLLYTYRHR